MTTRSNTISQNNDPFLQIISESIILKSPFYDHKKDLTVKDLCYIFVDFLAPNATMKNMKKLIYNYCEAFHIKCPSHSFVYSILQNQSNFYSERFKKGDKFDNTMCYFTRNNIAKTAPPTDDLNLSFTNLFLDISHPSLCKNLIDIARSNDPTFAKMLIELEIHRDVLLEKDGFWEPASKTEIDKFKKSLKLEGQTYGIRDLFTKNRSLLVAKSDDWNIEKHVIKIFEPTKMMEVIKNIACFTEVSNKIEIYTIEDCAVEFEDGTKTIHGQIQQICQNLRKDNGTWCRLSVFRSEWNTLDEYLKKFRKDVLDTVTEAEKKVYCEYHDLFF